MKKFQFRKYKEVYQVNIDIIKEVISRCGEISENIIFKENQNNKYSCSRLFIIKTNLHGTKTLHSQEKA